MADDGDDERGGFWSLGWGHLVALAAGVVLLAVGLATRAGVGGARPAPVAPLALLGLALVAYALAWWRALYVVVAPLAFLVAVLAFGPAALAAPSAVALHLAALSIAGLVGAMGGNVSSGSASSSLWVYIARRLALLVPVLIGISLITFGLAFFATCDRGHGFAYCLGHGHLETQYLSVTDRLSEAKIEQIRHLHGFDKPFYVQYFGYVKDALTGDLGVSTSFGSRPVTDVMRAFAPASAELAIISMVFAVVMGIPLGIMSATHRDKPTDHVARFVALSGVSVPVFWLALILQLFLSYQLGLHGFTFFPLNARVDPALLTCDHPVLWDDLSQFALSCGHAAPGLPRTGLLLIDSLVWRDPTAFYDLLRHILLPAFTLGFVTLAVIMRMMRASMLEVLGLDYVRTARAKGLEERVVINRHARRNALIPTLTVVGLAVGSLMGGAVLTETIFSWPGLGRWSTRAIVNVDIGGLMGFVLFTSIIYVTANLVVDLLYAYLDPRVRLE
jgi:peptide/nickel transport system permease protein